MKYNVRTNINSDGNIAQTVYQDDEGIRGSSYRDIARHIVLMQDEGVKAALRQLGWHHRSETAGLDIPDPDWQDPLRQGTYHRVFVHDIQAMEALIRDLRIRLNQEPL